MISDSQKRNTNQQKFSEKLKTFADMLINGQILYDIIKSYYYTISKLT